MTTQEYDAVLTTEEIISPEEFLKRRKAGEISPEKVKISTPSAGFPFGGFRVELAAPVYRVPFEKGRKNVHRG